MLIGRMYMQSGNGMAEQQCIPFGNRNITVFILCAIRSRTYSIAKLLVNAEWGMDIISLNGIFSLIMWESFSDICTRLFPNKLK